MPVQGQTLTFHIPSHLHDGKVFAPICFSLIQAGYEYFVLLDSDIWDPLCIYYVWGASLRISLFKHNLHFSADLKSATDRHCQGESWKEREEASAVLKTC